MQSKHNHSNKHTTSFTPRLMLLLFLYSMAFTLFLTGLRLFALEQKVQAYRQTCVQAPDNVLYAKESSTQIQQNVAKNIIRLHVIANSDSVADQELKLAVRDQIISSLRQSLSHAESVTDAQKILCTHQADICNTAKTVLVSRHSNAPVKVSLQTRYFPIKQYGDLVFPAGTYQALCIEIGKAEGRNWWCVLFPSLCFVDETTATVPDSSKESLKKRLTEEEYNALLRASVPSGQSPSETPIPSSRPEFRLGILDWLSR